MSLSTIIKNDPLVRMVTGKTSSPRKRTSSALSKAKKQIASLKRRVNSRPKRKTNKRRY
jgi:hypothetical protein